jgi:flagellar biosynthesis/type III secretory pathway chaperone
MSGTALQTNLRQQIACSRLLLETLAEENTALMQNEPEPLEAVTARKAAAAEQMRELGLQLSRLRAGHSGGMDRFLALWPEGPALQQDWQTLRDLAAQCQRANQTNAALLEARHQQVRQTLRQLRGETPPQTYGRGGYSAMSLGSQRLGAA